CARRTFDFW
nr:immunoglobulin heavy chain junction region [Mus musculus]MBK4187287.1 immunoglobulin heavy chain junction region [Mus musculus]